MGWRRGREVQDSPHHCRVLLGKQGGERFFLWSLQNEKKKIIRTFKKHILIQCPFCPGIFEC